MTRVLRVVLALAAVLALLAWFQLHRLRTSAPFREGTVTLAALDGTVEILRDSLGVPHIYASTERDLYLAQGLVHASDRLWQMDQLRRVAGGRLSELFGEVTIDTDRFLRALGMERAARRDLRDYPADVQALVEAYTTGVNAALTNWKGPFPPEFFLLRVRPEAWEAAHSVSIEKVMAWDLAAYGETVALTRAYQRHGPELYEKVAPWYPAWGVTIVGDSPREAHAERRGSGEGDVGDPGVAARPAPGAASAVADAGDDLPLPSGLGAALLEATSITRASNSWVVGGARTRSGKPLLANDMHLALGHPNVWYLVGLHAPGLDVVGMSLPGVPGVVAGHNRAVAWGFTNANLDDIDLFVERYAGGDPGRYETPDGSAPFESFEERILVKRGDPVTVTVRETRHGPVLADLDPGDSGDAVSLRWAALDPSTTFRALRTLNGATSVTDVIGGIDLLSNPHQNVVFADTAGDFGYWMGGTVPLRADGGARTLPQRGWTGRSDWTGVLPFADHPSVLNPTAGFVATANNRQTRDPVSLLISEEDWAPPFRAERITRLLEARSDHDVASMRAIQLDVVSEWERRYGALAVSAFRAAGLAAEADALESWDGAAVLESREAALLETWLRRLRTAMRIHTLGDQEAHYPLMALTRAIEGGDPAIDSLAREAALEATRLVGGRAWGEIHQLTVAHPMAALPVFGRLFGFGRAGIPRPGSSFTVDVAGFAEDLPPYEVTHGASQRHVVDLADLDGGGGFILPGGQSGLPAHRNSWDQLERWLRGDLWLLPLDRSLVEARTVERLELRPAG